MRDSGAAMPPLPVIVLVGPPSSGKSSLARCLAASPADFRLVDPDTLTEERAALTTATAVIFVLGATDGIDPATSYLWREVAAANLPRAVVVTKLDQPTADFDEVCALIWRLFDPHGCIPVTLPVLDDDERLAGFLDAQTGMIREYVDGGTRELPPEQQHLDLTAPARSRLQDTLGAMGDSQLSSATRSGLVTPILGFAAPGCVGRTEVRTILDWLAGADTSPTGEITWPGPLAAGATTTRLLISIPADYTEDVAAYLRRIAGVTISQDSPGDGTTTFTVEGDTDLLVRVPIDVHGLTDGTSMHHTYP